MTQINININLPIWSAFWICVAIFIMCEAVITIHGIDTMLWQFKTPNEIAIQRHIARVPE